MTSLDGASSNLLCVSWNLLCAPASCHLTQQLLYASQCDALLNLCDSLRHSFGVCRSGVVVALETPQGSLIKVPQHVSSEDYSSALSQRDPQAVMASLLGIVAAHRGVQHAPLAMLASQTKVFLALCPNQRTIIAHLSACKAHLLLQMVPPGPCTLTISPPLHPAIPYPATTSPPHSYPPHHLCFPYPALQHPPSSAYTDSLAMSEASLCNTESAYRNGHQ